MLDGLKELLSKLIEICQWLIALVAEPLSPFFDLHLALAAIPTILKGLPFTLLFPWRVFS